MKIEDFVPDESASDRYAARDEFALTSMLYWYPITSKLNIPQPRTIMVELEQKGFRYLDALDGDKDAVFPQLDEFKKAANEIGYPLFLRTDLTSIKHSWKNTCYLEKEEDLIKHIWMFIDGSGCQDRPINAFVFREYIPMKTLFRSFFGDTPINPEVRFFFKNNVLLCWHWYWVENAMEDFAIDFAKYSKMPDNWRDIIKEEKEKLHLTKPGKMVSPLIHLAWMTMEISKHFKGYWSVDYSLGLDGKWYMIDMATGDSSWHPEDCKVFKRMRDRME